MIKVQKSGDSKVIKLFGIPIIKRTKSIIGGGASNNIRLVCFTYYIFSLQIFKRSKIEGSLNGLKISTPKFHRFMQLTLQDRLNKISTMLDILWHSKLAGINFRGQLGQDAIAYILSNGKKDGFFIDIGAHNGVDISNSYMFEKLGWKGICVEANPKTFETLKANRNCDVYNYAVYSKNIGKTRMAISIIDVLDTLEINLTKHHKDRIEAHDKMNNKITNKIDYIEVETATFDEIMANYPNISHIDFMSLDVEGGELEVLKGIDFTKFSFGVITIEHNHIEESKNAIKNLLESNGYRLLMYNDFDFMFVRDEKICWN